MIRMRLFALGVMIFSVQLLTAPTFQQLSEDKGGEGEPSGPYEVDTTFQVQPMEGRPGYILGSKSGVFAESPDRIFIANRGELKLPDTLPPTQPPKVYTAPFDGTWGSLDLIPAVSVRSI